MWYLHCLFCLLFTHALFQTSYFKAQRHFEVILSSLWYVLVRDAATYREILALKLHSDVSQIGR